jgi:IS5 family transposase
VEEFRNTVAAREAYARRKYWVETVFGELKTSTGLRQAWLRGNWKVQVQVLMAFAVHNIKQMDSESLASSAETSFGNSPSGARRSVYHRR